MRPAAVGFQCPSCVKEGSRSTRSGRTAYGGQRPGNPALTSQILIGINVLVWVLILVTGGRSSGLIDRLALRPSGGGLVRVNGVTFQVPDGVAQGEYWQVATSMFSHVDLWHIGFNMLALWVLGPQLELAIGRARFLAVYLLSGLAGSATVLWLSAPAGLTLGASGAIFGLMGALLVVAIKVHGDVRGLLTWIGINFVLTLLVANISWQGHLGGFVGGLLLGGVIVYAPRERRTAWQVAGIAAVAALIVLASAVRIAALG
jgi:membrane associated rhomboid family serine protease